MMLRASRTASCILSAPRLLQLLVLRQATPYEGADSSIPSWRRIKRQRLFLISLCLGTGTLRPFAGLE